MMPGVELIIFDLDGTLIDTKLDIAHSVNWVLSDLGIPPLPFDIIYQHVGHGVRDLVENTVGANHRHRFDEAIALLNRYYAVHLLDHTRCIPGMDDVIESLQGRKLAVISNKPQKHVDALIKGLGLAGTFGVVFGREAVPHPKPAPDPLLKAMQLLATPPKRTVMIGDTEIDIEAGKRAGVRTVGCLFGFGTAHHVKEAKPSFIIHQAHELMDLFAL